MNNFKIKQLKEIVLKYAQEYMEPTIWKEFSNSLDSKNPQYLIIYHDDSSAIRQSKTLINYAMNLILPKPGNYCIYGDDFPWVRDLKAFINILTAFERMSEQYPKKNLQYFLRKNATPQDVAQLRYNYNILMSTDSDWTKYFKAVIKENFDYGMARFLVVCEKLWAVCTRENFEAAFDYVIEKVLSLDLYKEKYLRDKRFNKDKINEEKDDKEEGFFTVVGRKLDKFIKTLDPEKVISSDAKTTKNDKQVEEDELEFYPEIENESDTNKHLKKFSNGLKGINKFLRNYGFYKKASTMSRVSWLPTFYSNLYAVYTYFQEFEYKAIIADQASPLADKIKRELKQFNVSLQKLACLADQYEGEGCIREGGLLQYVDRLTKRYSLITNELKIPIDYSCQKRTFFKARLEAREKFLKQVDNQLNELSVFLPYKDYPLHKLPQHIRDAILTYIEKYENDICMNRRSLVKYKEYLKNAFTPQFGAKEFALKHMEHWGNQLGVTIHSDAMEAMGNMLMYLHKQKALLTKRLQGLVRATKNNPYDFFKESEVNGTAYQQVIFSVFKNRLAELNTEKDMIILAATSSDNISTNNKQAESKPIDIKSMLVKAIGSKAPDVVVTENKASDLKPKPKPKIKPKEISERLGNQITLKTREQGIFSVYIDNYEKSNDVLGLLFSMQSESDLSTKSLFLIEETSSIMAPKVVKQFESVLKSPDHVTEKTVLSYLGIGSTP